MCFRQHSQSQKGERTQQDRKYICRCSQISAATICTVQEMKKNATSMKRLDFHITSQAMILLINIRDTQTLKVKASKLKGDD
ncbi:hypothetical protein PVAP13_6KG388400 [Panicum virgatum]|uniref:Uncharacterized protein n=1 Tax=Panicum virgatum TaxID=38727 RepID=A0A8T0RHB4_PANVG|nr:hypothetical protein PVAP13_6KG388400 [Panicum virgatum]